jgi:DNA modification methylase
VAKPSVVLLRAHARALPLRSESVHCYVTSPPYWGGLRDYRGANHQVWGGEPDCVHEWGDGIRGRRRTGGTERSGLGAYDNGMGALAVRKRIAVQSQAEPPVSSFCVRGCGAWFGQLGQEPTIGLYVRNMVEVFREVRRVLRPEGTLWLNLGDCYAGDAGGGQGKNGVRAGRAFTASPQKKSGDGLKPKDLVGAPWRVALALQDDGWYLRAAVVWAKAASFRSSWHGSVMPESVRDRPTNAHEYVFLLSRSELYFYDQAAAMEACSGNSHPRGRGVNPKASRDEPGTRQNSSYSAAITDLVLERNLRSVWAITPTPLNLEACAECLKVYPLATFKHLAARVRAGSDDPDDVERRCTACGTWGKWLGHFAAYPEELVRPCIQLGTSERGACSACGAPWVRETEPRERVRTGGRSKKWGEQVKHGQGASGSLMTGEHASGRRTVGWAPSCVCDAGEARPCTVLDPFAGTGTTGRVALELGRSAALVDLSYPYLRSFARHRTSGVQMAML